MNFSRRQWLAWLFSSVAVAYGAQKPLIERWHDIAASTDGTVGASALHLNSGMLVTMNGDDKFPLASVCKLPIAMNILAMVDEGNLRLNDLIEIPSQDIFPYVSDVATRWSAERRFKLDELLELMIAKSDNTAVETLLRIGGGPSAMARRFERWQIAGIRIDRTERDCNLNAVGIEKLPKWDEWTPTLFDELTATIPAVRQREAMRAFTTDPRDTATPTATIELLRRLFSGQLLSRSSTARLIHVLESTTTGPARLKGLLPPGTIVAHKTGTTGTAQGFNAGTNDVGVVTLPSNAGKFAIAVYVKGSTRNETARERVIARIARTTFDAWITSDSRRTN